jgi:hypothetical protein
MQRLFLSLPNRNQHGDCENDEHQYDQGDIYPPSIAVAPSLLFQLIHEQNKPD